MPNGFNVLSSSKPRKNVKVKHEWVARTNLLVLANQNIVLRRLEFNFKIFAVKKLDSKNNKLGRYFSKI